MAKYISRSSPVSVASLKRRSIGAVVVHHSAYEDVRFTRVHGGWKRERTDFVGLSTEVVTSVQVANVCNRALGCKESWARIY